MKTPIQELIEELEKSKVINFELIDLLKDKLPKEKQHIVTSFNCGIREEFDNGMEYYNNVYEHRI